MSSIRTGVMGIVGCQVLEDEMAYVVAQDTEVRHVLIIDGTGESKMEEKIRTIAPDKTVISFGEEFNFRLYQTSTEMSVILWIKPISLHQSPPLLREAVINAVRIMEPLTKSVMLFYGQCGSAFRNMAIMTDDIRVPLTMLRDVDGALIDDCFGIALGGREEYRVFLINQPGPAYVLNTMWAANWRHFMAETQILRDPDNIDEAREVFKYMDYRRVVGLDTGLGDEAAFEHQLDEFARLFELEPETRRCTLKVVDRAYKEAKRRLIESAPD